MMRGFRHSIIALCITLSGCGPSVPQGQVIAVVDGQDITRRDLVGEVSGPLPADAAAQTRIVERVIDRRMLVRIAQERDFDKTPEYLTAVRRAREVELVRMLANRVSAGLAMPSPDRVAASVEKSPFQFKLRQRLTLERITSSQSGALDIALRKQNPGLAAAELDRRGIIYAREQLIVDTGDLDPIVAQKLVSSAGRGVRTGNSGVFISAREPVPMTADEITTRATALLRQADLDQALANLVSKERRTMSIVYQTGYGPVVAQ